MRNHFEKRTERAALTREAKLRVLSESVERARAMFVAGFLSADADNLNLVLEILRQMGEKNREADRTNAEIVLDGATLHGGNRL